ncbi:hypothetical protein [Mycobacteroides abscessus]|uniref:hypothetical protein n=1 Tax=Mycobacteroides abscessus TaxID=36809 RepID=UPI001F2B0699|nr:hypothetical protein [Mycobacteroides abscessus]
MLTLTGSRPSLEQAVRPTPATLTLTGGVPVVSVGHTVTPTPATLTLTGGVPTVTLTDNKLITPTAATLTLTGGVPTVSVLSPISIDQVGTPGSENTGNLTCSINPTSGADVLVFAWCIDAASSCYQAIYSGNRVRFLGRAKLNGGSLSVFLVEDMSSGSATVTVEKSGSGWAQAAAVTYTGAVDFRQAKIALGSGTSVSQSASPGLSSRSIQSFCRGGNNGTFGSLSGGTNRVNETSGFVAGTVSDTSTSTTFSGTLSTSANWGSVVIDALPQVISGPKINYTSGVWTEANGGTQTFTVKASAGDYIVVDMVQAASGDPSSVTLRRHSHDVDRYPDLVPPEHRQRIPQAVPQRPTIQRRQNDQHHGNRQPVVARGRRVHLQRHIIWRHHQNQRHQLSTTKPISDMLSGPASPAELRNRGGRHRHKRHELLRQPRRIAGVPVPERVPGKRHVRRHRLHQLGRNGHSHLLRAPEVTIRAPIAALRRRWRTIHPGQTDANELRAVLGGAEYGDKSERARTSWQSKAFAHVPAHAVAASRRVETRM